MPKRPATTPEHREQQLVALAVDLAEKQLREGNASAQVITHYLKLGSTREQLEQQRLGLENQLTRAKTDEIASRQQQEELYTKAIRAMRQYGGDAPQEEDGYDED